MTKNSQLLQQAAAKKLLQRRAARKSLIDFTRYTFPKYRPADSHYLLAEKAEAVLAGEIKRLIVNKPPRHGKSELVSRRLPAYSMGHYPERNIICGAYGADLAADFGEDVRNIIRDPLYSHVFPGISLSKSSQAKNKWKVNKDGVDLGTYLAVGVGSAVTGFGGHLLDLDDPHKDREEADSERARERVWKWYVGTAYTRLESDITDDDLPWLWQEPDVAVKEGHLKPYEGAIILTQTRWHEDDLTGRLLEKSAQGGEQWETLELPALSEKDGKIFALWPEKYDVPALERIKETIGNRDFNSQYQQDPTPDEGAFFKREWFDKRWSTLPANLNYFIGADYATTEDGGDYTEIGVFGVDPNRHIYVVDWFSGQVTSKEWLRELFQFVKKYDVKWHAAEPGIIRRMSEATIKDKMVEESLYFSLKWIGGGNSKEANAYSFRNLCESGRVYWPQKDDTTERVITQLLKAFGGKYDDAIDACSCFGLEITKAWKANP
ncbi:MAG: terminase large subunit domain-containing protein, partial [Marinomonas sp.]